MLLELPEKAADLAAALAEDPPAGFLDAVPGARTLLVLFDPDRFDPASLGRAAAARRTAPRTVRLAARYDGSDLKELARETRIAPGDLARLHSAAEYTVAFLGFAPGFAYMTGTPPPLAVPRLKTPRVRVPAGSLAVADGYTGIYPAETPGGWRLIGRVAARLFDPRASPPALLRPGDRVVFESVEELGEAPSGSPAPAVRDPVARVVSPGPFTTVQGGPRYGLSASGVPAGGAMDLASLAAANALAGNAPFAAALEITIAGPELEFVAPARIAVEGSARDVRSGERVKIGAVRRGARAYLAVDGGLAQSLPGEPTRPLRRGEELARASAPPALTMRPPPLPDRLGESFTVRAVPGPQTNYFADPEAFFAAEYRLSPDSDRRGLRLQGPPLALARPADLPPEGTAPGAVQVPGNGMPIVLGPDRPVTGGYAKIATVISADLPLLAQARPGATIRFRAVDLAEALAARKGGA